MVHCPARRGVEPGKGDRTIATHPSHPDHRSPLAPSPALLALLAGTVTPAGRRRTLRSALLAAAIAAAPVMAAPVMAQDSGAPESAPQPEARQPAAADRAPENAPETGEARTPAPARPAAPAPQPVVRDEPVGPGMFEFNFTDGVDLTVLVDYVADAFGLQIVLADGSLMGEKVFLPSPITIPANQVLNFLNELLEQKGFTLSRGSAGVYRVQRAEQVQPGLGEDPFSATRIIPTPGVRPSSLAPALAVIGVGSGVAQPNVPGRAAGAASVAYLDDLGVILITASARQTQEVQKIVNRLVAEQASIGFQRIELQHVAASYARERVLELIGSTQQVVARPNVPGQPNAPAQLPGGGVTLLNLEDRLTVDSQTNSLIFRGRPDETSELTRLLAIVDAPNTLISRWYAVGSAAPAVASEGQRRALGRVVTEQGAFPGGITQGVRFQVPGFQQQSVDLIGTGFVVFPEAGGFVYRGTEAQHRDVERLIDNLSELTSAEHVVVEFYKLRHSDAEAVAEILQNLLTNQLPAANSPLLGRDTRGQLARRTPPPPPPPAGQAAEGEAPAEGAVAGAAPDEIGAIVASEDTHVLADTANNQIVVKAPKRLQPQFARLIERLDLRRPQVYIDAKIVAVTASDEFRLAFETQLVAGQFGLNTNFGLGSFAEGGTITDTKGVPPLSALTAAVIRSDQVPFIINALQNNTDTRILSTPQLLVDDNESATVASIERQPFAQTVQTAGSPTVTSQGGESEAGTTLIVTPQISEGGYLRLDYEIELSSFLGSAASPGLAPPSQVNNISADSVTVPSDSTIVVGGLTFESDTRTVIKVPLLGDIPIIGHLFRDQGKANRKTTLYVFITPTIMREPNFADLRLLTKGPAAVAGIKPDLPERGPVRIDIVPSTRARAAAPALPPPSPATGPGPGPGPEPEPGTAPNDGWIAPTPPSRSNQASLPADRPRSTSRATRRPT